jgi:hypothetical protein
MYKSRSPSPTKEIPQWAFVVNSMGPYNGFATFHLSDNGQVGNLHEDAHKKIYKSDQTD